MNFKTKWIFIHSFSYNRYKTLKSNCICNIVGIDHRVSFAVSFLGKNKNSDISVLALLFVLILTFSFVLLFCHCLS